MQYVKLQNSNNSVYLLQRGQVVESKEVLNIFGKITRVTRYFSEDKNITQVTAIYNSLGYKYVGMVKEAEA